MNKIIFVSMFVIGLIGLFVGTLPDILPEKMGSLLFCKYKKMDIAYKKLVHYANIPRGIRESDAALNRRDIGHHVIYGLLRSINPAMPSLENLASTSGDLTVDSGGFVNTNTELLMNQVVHVKDDKNEWLPVCELRDLYFFIHDSQIRFFTRIGFALTLLSIVVTFFINIRQASNT